VEAHPGEVSPRARAIAQNLRVDHLTARVLRAFEDAHVRSILLKGPSTARWLFPGEGRTYRDCDLLVAPDDIANAERTLEGLGLVPEVERSRMPTWWNEDAIAWFDSDRGGCIDIHSTLVGVGVDDHRLWETFSADTETMQVGGHPAPVLSLPGRLLTLTLHAAKHGGDQSDLRRALVRADPESWQEAAKTAMELDAIPAFATGLRLFPRGRQLAETLDLPPQRSLEVVLRATGAPAETLTLDRLAEAEGIRERLAIVGRKLFPPPTFMRHWSPLARRGRAGLMLAYGRRIAWVLRTARPTVRAWRGVREAARHERSRAER
jgi:hypothetical protein